MSELKKNQGKREHGTTQSYIIGFLLSLILTGNAYYLVVSKAVTGNALLATILTLAVTQMLIQIFFFLHLGRGPKPLYNVIFFISTVGIILVVVLGSVFIINNLHYNMSSEDVTKKLAQEEGIAQVGGEETGACQEIGANYRVTIKNGVASPAHIEARLCDTLTFINEDGESRTVSFGTRSDPQGYGGNEGVTVRKGYTKTITLNTAGTYQYFNELNTELTGSFTVTP